MESSKGRETGITVAFAAAAMFSKGTPVVLLHSRGSLTDSVYYSMIEVETGNGVVTVLYSIVHDNG